MRHLTPVLLASLLPAATGCVVIPIGDLLKGPALEERVLVEGEDEKVALIDIDGLIRGDERESVLFPEENTVAEVQARLDLVRRDRSVKAVVLRISSPGGEVTACDVIHHEVRKLKEERKVPIVASILDQGTSGAYYIAVAGDKILAQPTSIVGSIGVLLPSFDLSGLLAKIGVAVSPIKSTEGKDLNSPFRPPSEADRKVLQALVDDMYRRFVAVVDEGRPGLNSDEVLRLADGRVVSGGEAVALKLADRLGYLPDAIDEAARAAGVESPTVVRYARAPRSGANLYSQAFERGPTAGEIRVSASAALLDAPRLYYLWRPGL
jgi:protease-4